MTVYRVGDCPVCSPGCTGSGDFYALADKASGALVFYCYGCSCAWHEIPKTADSIQSIQSIAPNGVRAATKAELSAKRLVADHVEKELPNGAFWP